MALKRLICEELPPNVKNVNEMISSEEKFAKVAKVDLFYIQRFEFSC